MDGDPLVRSLTNGTILHGSQFIEPPERRLWPTTYYGKNSGVGRAVALMRTANGGGPIRLGVIGLGVGTMAAYGLKGDTVVFYDINPAVVDVARSQFAFVPETTATTQIVLGDARLSLEREAPRGYDVLAVDAFSSDSIPVHLLTSEAFTQYFRHLRPGGIVAVHVSNRHVNLQPVVARAAQDAGRAALLVSDATDPANEVTATEWVLVSDRPGLTADPALKDATQTVDTLPGFRGWTDDYVNLWSLLKAVE